MPQILIKREGDYEALRIVPPAPERLVGPAPSAAQGQPEAAVPVGGRQQQLGGWERQWTWLTESKRIRLTALWLSACRSDLG